MGTSVYLMRHGEAESGQGPDAERVLTVHGVEALRAAAQGLAAMGIRFDRGLSSPLVRAWQTAEILWQELGLDEPLEPVSALQPGASPERVLEEIRLAERARAVLVVGHMPDLCQIAAHLASATSTRISSFAPGAMARIDFDGAATAGGGRVAWTRRVHELAAVAEEEDGR